MGQWLPLPMALVDLAQHVLGGERAALTSRRSRQTGETTRALQAAEIVDRLQQAFVAGVDEAAHGGGDALPNKPNQLLDEVLFQKGTRCSRGPRRILIVSAHRNASARPLSSARRFQAA